MHATLIPGVRDSPSWISGPASGRPRHHQSRQRAERRQDDGEDRQATGELHMRINTDEQVRFGSFWWSYTKSARSAPPMLCVLEYFRRARATSGLRPHPGDEMEAMGNLVGLLDGRVFDRMGQLRHRRSRSHREPIHVTLSHPRSICGHEVFTAARLIKPDGTFNEPTQLDRVPVLGHGCAAGAHPEKKVHPK